MAKMISDGSVVITMEEIEAVGEKVDMSEIYVALALEEMYQADPGREETEFYGGDENHPNYPDRRAPRAAAEPGNVSI
jgi:hypothetical protein